MRFYKFQATLYSRTEIEIAGYLLRDSKYNHIHALYHHHHNNCISSNCGKKRKGRRRALWNNVTDTLSKITILCLYNYRYKQ